jgi:hypothetical protein
VCLDAIRAAGTNDAAIIGRVLGVYKGTGPHLHLEGAFARETSS